MAIHPLAAHYLHDAPGARLRLASVLNNTGNTANAAAHLAAPRRTVERWIRTWGLYRRGTAGARSGTWIVGRREPGEKIARPGKHA